MNISLTLAGLVRIRITSAAVTEILRRINQLGIALYNISVPDELTLEVTIQNRHYKAVSMIVTQRGDQVTVVDKYGTYWKLLALKNRPLLIIGILLFVCLSFYLPTRIFFISVEGNQQLKTESILSAAETLGIHFGASRQEVRSEQVKNTLLAKIPELQWAGINTYGCVAVISVRERNETTLPIENNEISGIVAKCDGVISEITAYRGNVLCRVGQAVKEGDLLVSGYTDCGTHIIATSAKAEIYAKTLHSVSSIMPLQRQYRKEVGHEETKISLIIGKNIIKLYNDSGISDTRCVKMYTERHLTLPGGFRLPIAIGIETRVFHKYDDGTLSYNSAAQILTAQTALQLKSEMISGSIQSAQTSFQTQDQRLHLKGEYYCQEMIGQIYREEIIYEYERNGKNP